MHQMYGERLGACAASLLSEESGASAPAVMMVNKERKNENTA